MIIGISGKKNSGKDTVGEIIQYLLIKNILKQRREKSPNVLDILEMVPFRDYDKRGLSKAVNFEIKSFSKKIKEVVCLLTGCTMLQLEDRDFKESEIGEDWVIWKHIDTDLLTTTIFNTEKEAWDYAEQTNSFQPIVEEEKLTYRKLFTLIGTDCGRIIVHPNIWINALMSNYKPTHKIGLENPNWEEGQLPNWIITDVRFLNELEATKKHKGFNIRVNRPFNYNTSNIQQAADQMLGKEHISETELDNVKLDYTISNNGSIDNLVEKVKKILIKENVI